MNWFLITRACAAPGAPNLLASCCQRKVESSASPQDRKFRFLKQGWGSARGKGWCLNLLPLASAIEARGSQGRISHRLPDGSIAKLVIAFFPVSLAVQTSLFGSRFFRRRSHRGNFALERALGQRAWCAFAGCEGQGSVSPAHPPTVSAALSQQVDLLSCASVWKTRFKRCSTAAAWTRSLPFPHPMAGIWRSCPMGETRRFG